MGTLSDDMSRLVAIQVRQHQGGRAAELRRAAFGAGRDGLGRVAKACGTTPSVVEAWEAGEAQPTTQQGLAWLMVLYGRPLVSVNGNGLVVSV